MLFHMSIAANDPQRVAGVFAELWGGQIMPFPPVAEGSWVAMAGDDRGACMEVYPANTVLRPAEGDADAYGDASGQDRFTATHAAIGTAMDQAAVMKIAEREAWPAKYRKRGGMFGVIELWIEGRQMVEVLTPDMQAEYLAAVGAMTKAGGFGGPPAH